MVLGLCRLLLRDPVEAEDAAQQTFVSAQRAVLGGVVPRDPPAWLAAIARNECRARLRSRPTQPLPLEAIASGRPDPFDAAIDRADFEAVWAALAALPRRQRRALLLREVGGLTYAELGVALGVPQTAVQSLLFRARRQLRDAVGAVGSLWAPIALREPLTRLLAGPPATVAKIAAVATGAAVGAVSVVELPQHSHRPHAAVSHAKRLAHVLVPATTPVLRPARPPSAAPAPPPPVPVVAAEERPENGDDGQLAKTGDEADSGGGGQAGPGGGEPGSESGGD